VELNPSLESIGASRSHPMRSRSVSEAELIFDQTKPNIQKATKKLHYYLTLQKKASKNENSSSEKKKITWKYLSKRNEKILH
jgi:DNA topoisomerase VI subunit B